MKHKNWFLAAALIAGLAACQGKPDMDTPTKERVQAFKAVLKSFEPLGLMVREKQPWDAAEFTRLSGLLAEQARAPFEHFAAAPTGASRAKAEIWSKPAEFSAERDKFYAAVDALAAAGKKGQLDAVKASYGQVAQSCKSCHDAFRTEKTD